MDFSLTEEQRRLCDDVRALCSRFPNAYWREASIILEEIDSSGGSGFSVEHDVEQKFRETRLHTAAPVGNNLVMAYIGQHVLGMPRSY